MSFHRPQDTTLAGDVTGTTAASTVAKLQGRTLASTAPATGEAVTWDGAQWEPGTPTAADSPATKIIARNALK